MPAMEHTSQEHAHKCTAANTESAHVEDLRRNRMSDRGKDKVQDSNMPNRTCTSFSKTEEFPFTMCAIAFSTLIGVNQRQVDIIALRR